MGTLCIGLILLSAYCYGSEKHKRPHWPKGYQYSIQKKSLTNGIVQRYTVYVSDSRSELRIDISALGNKWPANKGDSLFIYPKKLDLYKYSPSLTSGELRTSCRHIKYENMSFVREYYLPAVSDRSLKFKFSGADGSGYFDKERWQREEYKDQHLSEQETVIVKYHTEDTGRLYPMPFSWEYKKFTIPGGMPKVHESYTYYDYHPEEPNKKFFRRNFQIKCKDFKPLQSDDQKESQNADQPDFPNQEETSNYRHPPTNFDWRIQGAVTPVKDQGRDCDSSWAFAAAGAMESFYYRKHKHTIDISEQMLIDCSWDNNATTEYINEGCSGGYAITAFDWIKSNGGILRTADYGPYLAIDGYCKTRYPKSKLIPLKKYKKIKSKRGIERALVRHGPVAVVFPVDKKYNFYKSGIYKPKRPFSGYIAGLLVGYSRLEEEEKSYWLIKMSWGTAWGLGGHLHLIQKVGPSAINYGSVPVY